jgi:hypothetical protein
MKDEDGNWQPTDVDFSFRPVLKRVPRALWGERLEQEMNGERYVENVLSGLEIIPAAPPRPGETQWIAKEELQYTTTHLEPAIAFESMTAFTAENIDPNSSITAYLKTSLTGDTTMNNRRSLLEALGFDYHRLDIELLPGIADELIMEPQVGRLV